MAQCVMCLLNKHEELSSVPLPNSLQKPGMAVYTCNPCAGMKEEAKTGNASVRPVSKHRSRSNEERYPTLISNLYMHAQIYMHIFTSAWYTRKKTKVRFSGKLSFIRKANKLKWPRRNERKQTYTEIRCNKTVRAKGIETTLGMRKDTINIIENHISNVVNNKKLINNAEIKN